MIRNRMIDRARAVARRNLVSEPPLLDWTDVAGAAALILFLAAVAVVCVIVSGAH